MSARAVAAAPALIDCCDMCGDCPVQDVVHRCSVCRVWALCGPCQGLASQGVQARPAAAFSQGWLQGGPCAHCGARNSALWRRGGRGTWLCNACVVLGDAGAELFVLEEHDASHALQRRAAQPSAAAEALHAGKLSSVVANAVQRWFCETLRLAKQGDANQMELLAQMLHEGYGCLQDEEKARWWHLMAREHGARRLEGVYDALP